VRVTVNDRRQLKYRGTIYRAGESFEMPAADAERWVNHGRVTKAEQTSKNKAVTTSENKAENLVDFSVAELRKRAADAEVEGRSGMNKKQLVKALGG
jgi:predicted NBD/HSP70 family sugar kinase